MVKKKKKKKTGWDFIMVVHHKPPHLYILRDSQIHPKAQKKRKTDMWGLKLMLRP